MQLFAVLFVIQHGQRYEVKFRFLDGQRNHAFGLERQSGPQIRQGHVGEVGFAEHHSAAGINERSIFPREFEPLDEGTEQSGDHIGIHHLAIHHGSTR